ncbi:E3 ubiquitin-protein ligase TRIM39, partial [Tachysurus ichikawai]
MAEFNSVANVEGQSHSICVVRWKEETLEVHSSAPSSPFKSGKSTSSRVQ